jgi:hypothetical protein
VSRVHARRALLAAAAVATLITCPALAATPPAPGARDAALADGCQRSAIGVDFDLSPEWVYVDRNPAMRMAEGTVRVAHPALQDSVLQHSSYDFIGNLVPDRPFRYLLAGSPSAHTNNFAAGAREAQGRLQFRWESATLPSFAWPTDGDRATLWGSWVWDCGRWQSTGGTITGERSQLHPLSAIAVNRRNPYLARRGETQTDVFVSNEGNGAHAVERCALGHHPLTAVQYDEGFRPCTTTATNRIQTLARSYSFFVPAPPKPSRKAQLRYRITDRIGGRSGRQGSERIRVRANGIDVSVTLRRAAHEVRYGKSFFVSWSGRQRHRPTALDVTLRTLVIDQADPNPAIPDPTGAHWTLYLDLNGYWQLLSHWVPDLGRGVVDGQRFVINRMVRVYVPARSPVWLQVAGRECDEPAGTVVLGVAMNLLYPCPANDDELNTNVVDIFRNDDPGTILDVYASPAGALGTHTSSSATVTDGFPGSGPITFGNGRQGEADYQLTYSIRRG